MPEYYYNIKGRNKEGYWSWPPLFSGKVEAENTMEARETLEGMLGIALPMSVPKRKKKSKDSNDVETPLPDLLLHLEDLTGKSYLRDRFVPKNCRWCQAEYTDNEKYMLNSGGQSAFCSAECMNKFKEAEGIKFSVDYDFNGIHEPVIYKITSKVTGMCYIGKTTQAFTLRWYQHFYQGGVTQFHEAITKHALGDWVFEVVEVINIPSGTSKADTHRIILEREMYYISLYDSIGNGYNTATSLVIKKDVPDIQMKIEL